VRGDKTIAYGTIMTVMGAVNAAGFSRVALIAETPQFATSPKPKPRPRAKPKPGEQ
jgi:biopolymer transport protein TolR